MQVYASTTRAVALDESQKDGYRQALSAVAVAFNETRIRDMAGGILAILNRGK